MKHDALIDKNDYGKWSMILKSWKKNKVIITFLHHDKKLSKKL